jgi:tetratricopeptide (TPR) repeat protein
MNKIIMLLFIGTICSGIQSMPTLADERIDNIPMYGQPDIPRPGFMRKSDEDFIDEAIALFKGDRKAASIAWWKQGEEFMSKRDLDMAMRRYNQAWLLDPDSFKPYSGFGRILLERDKIDEAIQYLEKSKLLCEDTFERVALLTDLGGAFSFKATQTSADQLAERTKAFKTSNDYFTEASSVDPSFGNVWRRWAMALYREGKFTDASEKVSKAQSVNAKPFPTEFLKALQLKLTEPK